MGTTDFAAFGTDVRLDGPGGLTAGSGSSDAASDGSRGSRAVGDPPPPLLPAPVLPSGGGTIQGVGEKFSVAPARGAATLTVPLSLSPGRGGGTPALALSYDSGSGSSAFGLGFDLTLPRVSRRTSHGVPVYTDDDVFVISDADDLVPALTEQTDGTWTPDSRDETIDGDVFRIERFRPRVDSGDARIERCTSTTTGDVFWRSVSRTNVTSLYGRTTQARVADPADPTRVAEWLLEQSTDDRGNVASYVYKPEDLANVAADSLHERNRLSGPAPAAKYLKQVHYGNLTPGAAQPAAFLVVFDYGEHDQAPDEVRTWPAREDPLSSYRYGFEVRRWRLCRRVLVFHDLPDEFRADGGPLPRLVRSTDFGYAPSPVATTLTSATHTGYQWSGSAYAAESLPPVEFGYTTSAPDDTARVVTSASPTRSGNPVPADPDTSGPFWIDLDGEGLPGALSHTGGAWWYQRNLGGGVLGEPEAVTGIPAPGSPEGRLVLSDLAGDGHVSLVQYSPLFGAAERSLDAAGGWAPFRALASRPLLDFDDPALHQVDLVGDGLADLVAGTGDGLRWYRSLGADGYGPARETGWPHAEEQGPPLGAFDATGRTMLVDVTGDGLADVVRVHNGEFCYWPGLGHGRFGAKVTMDGSPVFDADDLFDPRRIRLADLDGSGPADLIYLGRNGARWWPNQAGNAFGAARDLPGLPPVDGLTRLDVVDLLGTGTACLVWSSPLSGQPGSAGSQTSYLDLSRGTDPSATVAGADPAGHRPWLLCSVTPNTGAETRVSYAPSTRYYLADRAAGQPWVTRLPYPVSCVAQVAISDAISGSTFTSGYRYRHGFFDGVEREFRGFGMVEHVDTDAYTDPPDLATGDLPPVRTRDWYHTGGYADVLTDLYTGDAKALPLSGPDIDGAATGGPATGDEYREALRALAGTPLRTEVYSDDGTTSAPHPYSVTDHRHRVVRRQPRENRHYAAFQVFERESLTYQYERNPADPRVSHLLVLDVDAYGAVLSRAVVGYARRVPQLPEQSSVTVMWSQEQVANRDDASGYRVGSAIEHRDYEMTGLPYPSTNSGGRYSVAQLSAAFGSAIEVAFETIYSTAPPPPVQPTKRCVTAQRMRYWADDLSAPLPLGQVGTRALTWQTYRLAITPGLFTVAYGSTLSSALLASEGGYLQEDGAWWSGTGVLGHDAAGFYLPTSQTSPFGNVATVSYDAYRLLPNSSSMSGTAPYDKLTTAYANDYRVLTPAQVTDPNGNRRGAAFSPLGLVTASWTMGKQGGTDGDTEALPGALYTYGLDEWRLTGRPLWAETDLRERHADAASPFQRARLHTDGLGRAAMRKIQAEPGLAWTVDGHGQPVQQDTGTAPRWIGTGRTVYNNKGLAVEQYEPYFSVGPDFEDADALVKQGVTPVSRFDPLGRLVRTDHPEGVSSTVEFDPWQQVTRDAGDNVLTSSWYAQRQGGAPVAEQRAATLSAAYANTPTTELYDALGRAVRTQLDNGPSGVYTTSSTLDIKGQQLSVTDARGVLALSCVYDVSGRVLMTDDLDSGRVLVLPDCDGLPIRRVDTLGHVVTYAYDQLRRPIETWVLDPGASSARLTDLAVYAESDPQAATLNLLGAVRRRYDQAGMQSADAADFKNNVTSRTRRFTTLAAAAAGQVPDWSALHGQPLSALDGLTSSILDTEAFTNTAQFDALNRPVLSTLPEGTRVQPTYSAAGLLTAVGAYLGSSTAVTPFVTDIEHDVKGRRQKIAYACGATTTYAYDPLTYRLIGLSTTGSGTAPPTLQSFAYTYDCVGNLVEVDDLATQTVFFDGAVVAPGARYTFEPVYRLSSASGREHASLGVQPDNAEPTYEPLPHPNDANALRTYTENYTYDAVGNITALAHSAGATGTWTRRYTYGTLSNRLLSHSRPGDPPNSPGSAVFVHDANGRMTTMAHLPGPLGWDFADRLVSADLGGGGSAYYAYDAADIRARKVVVRAAGLTEETLRLGDCEYFRRYSAGTLVFERRTVHMMDGPRRVALVETVTVDTQNTGPGSAPALRYQLGDALGSCVVELDDTGSPISYEEYHPYGTTSLWMARGAAVTSTKRYRYTGKEKDDETGLYYFGARYYACWLGRWTSADPAGGVDGPNLYVYARDKPVVLSDPDGHQSKPPSGVDAHSHDRSTSVGYYTGDEISEIYGDHPPKYFDYGDDPVLSPQLVQHAQQRMTAGRAKRAEAKKDPKNKAPSADQLWDVAIQSAENWAAQRAASELPAPVQQLAQPLVDKLKNPEPPENPTNLYDYEMRDSYDAMQHALTTAEIALSFVAPMIAESAVESGTAGRTKQALGDLLADERGAIRIPPFGSTADEAGTLENAAVKEVAPGNPRLAPNADAGSRLKGEIGDAASVDRNEGAGRIHLGSQVTLDVEGAKRIRIDNVFLAGDENGVWLEGPESKLGRYAHPTKNQSVSIPKTGDFVTATPRGANAARAGLTPGVPIRIYLHYEYWLFPVN